MRPFHRVFCAVAIIAAMAFEALLAGAQTTKTEPANDPTLELTGTKTTTTSADGRTTTTTTRLKGSLPGGRPIERNTTVVTVTDAAGNPVSDQTNYISTVFDTDHPSTPKSSETVTDTKKFNETGGYSETINTSRNYDSEEREKSHREQQCDAAGNVISGTATYTHTDTSGLFPKERTSKSHFDAEKKQWVIDTDVSLTPVQPEPNTISNPDEQIVAPPVSGASGQIMVTYTDPGQPDHSQINVAVRKQDGSTSYLRGSTDDEHHLFLTVPSGAIAITFFKGFDGSGKPDAHAVTTTVSNDASIPGLQSVPGTSPGSSQPAIVGANTAYDLNAGTVTVQTQHTSYSDTLTLNGAPLSTLAMSNRCIVARIPRGTTLGRQWLGLETNATGSAGQAVPTDLVTLTPEPMARVEHVGQTATPTIHVLGLPPGDTAVMTFSVGGSAELIGGGTSITVPVVGNVARCTIIGRSTGEAIVHFQLHVTLARTPGL